jgi:hypothetical protein
MDAGMDAAASENLPVQKLRNSETRVAYWWTAVLPSFRIAKTAP